MFIIQPVDNIFDRFVSSNVVTDDAVEYSATTTYKTGDICKVTAEGTVYKCIADSVTLNETSVPILGIYPPNYLVSDDATYPWMELRAINYMAMFDAYTNTQTQSDSGVDFIEVVLSAGSCDSLALFNLTAKQVTVSLYDNQNNLISQETQDTYSIVSTLDDYFFTEVAYKKNIVFNFGLGIGGTVKIKISNDGSTAKCGMVILGKKIYLGATKDEVELPITDYSTYKTDTLGRTKLAVGFYADICNFTLYLIEKRSGRPFWNVRDILISLRGKTSVWCVDNTDKTWETNPSLMVCGYFTDLNPVFRSGGCPTCDIKLTGVV